MDSHAGWTLKLWQLDVLPPGCSLEAVVAYSEGEMLIRFRAIRPKKSRVFKKGVEKSKWSGMFTYEGEPIQLNWAAFWPDVEIDLGTEEPSESR